MADGKPGSMIADKAAQTPFLFILTRGKDNVTRGTARWSSLYEWTRCYVVADGWVQSDCADGGLRYEASLPSEQRITA